MKIISEISPFYLIFLTIVSFAIAYFLYSGKVAKQFATRLRWLLFALRGLGLFLIGILFLGLFLQTTKTKVEKPILINLIDNSQSMRNYADSNQFEKQISAYLKDLQTQFGGNYVVKNYTIGAKINKLDSLTYNEDRTNLSSPFSSLAQQFYGNNIGAVVLISDGNYNEGDHPLYAASNLNHVPVFGLGVGDTITKKDISVKNVLSNDFVYLGNLFPVEALIEAKKLGNRTVNVRLVHQGKTLATKTLQISSSNAYYKVNFQVEAKTKGVQYYQVVVDPVDDEYTTKNNSKGFYIEVVNEQRNVLLLATAPHPDVAALKSALESEQNNKVTFKLVKDWNHDVSKYDLVIFHNPLQGNAALLQQIIEQKKPVLTILGVKSRFDRNSGYLGMAFSASNQMDENVPIYNSNFDLFEVSKETQQQLKKFPPLRSVFGRMSMQGGASILLYQGVGNVQKNDAQWFFHTTNGVKIGVVMGEGLWRWKLYDYANFHNTDAFNELVTKSAQYLTTKKNNSPFRVYVPKRVRANEPVLIKAEVYNASQQLVTNSPVDFKLTNAKGISQDFSFQVNGNYYTLNLGKLNAGSYQWLAKTMIDGHPQQLTGELVVEKNDIEKVENTANFQTLMQLSNQTGGKFYPVKAYRKLLQSLAQNNEIRPVESQEKKVKNLIDYWWLILLIVGVFGTEWFLKKYNGNY